MIARLFVDCFMCRSRWCRRRASADAVVPGKSEIAFTLKQMGVNFDGRFKAWKADIVFQPAALDKAKASHRRRSRERRSRERRFGGGSAWPAVVQYGEVSRRAFRVDVVQEPRRRSLRGRRQAFAQGRHARMRRTDRREARRGRQPHRGRHVLAEAARVQDRRRRMGGHRHRRRRHPRARSHRVAGTRLAPGNKSMAARVCPRADVHARRPRVATQPRRMTLNFRLALAALAALVAVPAARAGNVRDRPGSLAAAVGGDAHRVLEPARQLRQGDRQDRARPRRQEGLDRRLDRRDVDQDLRREARHDRARASGSSTSKSFRR